MIQYSAFLDDQRAYDVCVDRVSRSAGVRKFNDTLIAVIEENYPDREDVVARLKDAELPQLDISSCGEEPSFLLNTNEEVNR